MGKVRKQSIQSVIFIYLGFAIGAFNFWLLPHILDTEQFGLIRVMISVSVMIAGVCSFGMQQTITRFYPYYDQGGKNHKTDFITWTFIIGFIGFLLFIVWSIFFKELIVQKFKTNADLFLRYFPLIYPFTFFILLYGLLERIAWARQYTVFSSFLKETGVRFFVSLVVIALALGWLDFTGFVTLYSLQYGFAIIIIVYFLFGLKKTRFSFQLSRTTRRLYKHMGWYSFFIFGGSIFFLVEQYFNTILLGSKESLSTAGVFDIAFFMATLILVPKRGMQGAAAATIARAWKRMDLEKLKRVYKKSAATLLIAGLFILGLIWLNIDDIFKLYKPEYSAGKYIVLLVGIANLTDLGTGLNYDILMYSRIWKLNFWLNVMLIIFFLLVTYFMVSKFGMMGSAYSILLSFAVYNLMRFLLLWWKYRMQPFSFKTILILLTAIAAYFISALLLPDFTNIFVDVLIHSAVFTFLFTAGVLGGKLSEELTELYHWGLEKVGIEKGRTA